MQNSADNKQLSQQEVEKKLSSIEIAHQSLNTIKDEIMQTSADFVAKVENLVSSLNSTRAQISVNNLKSGELAKEFENLYAGVSK